MFDRDRRVVSTYLELLDDNKNNMDKPDVILQDFKYSLLFDVHYSQKFKLVNPETKKSLFLIVSQIVELEQSILKENNVTKVPTSSIKLEKLKKAKNKEKNH